jgi:hypothetical protein
VSVQQLPLDVSVHQVHVHVTVDELLCVIFALLAAASNAVAAVLQRKAAAQVPLERSMHVSLIADLMHRRVWLAGIAMVIVAAVAQATALAFGPIALVQPIFIIELPLTLLLSTLLFRGRDSLHLLPWRAIIITTVALGGGLAAAQPSGAVDSARDTSWMIALIVTAAFEAVLIGTAVGLRGEPRAALLGLAAACGYALTAALLKNAMADLNVSVEKFFTSWHIYAVAVAGVGSLFLLQNALQAGSLVASQPMLTVGDALISIAYGVTLFGEVLRDGWWLVPQLIALAAIIYGCVQIAKSPLASEASPLVTEVPSTVQLRREQAGRPRAGHHGSPLANRVVIDRQRGQQRAHPAQSSSYHSDDRARPAGEEGVRAQGTGRPRLAVPARRDPGGLRGGTDADRA